MEPKKRPVYKYHRYNAHLYELLLNNKFYCATHAELNDPFDLRFTMTADFIQTLGKNYAFKGRNHYVENLIQEYNDNANRWAKRNNQIESRANLSDYIKGAQMQSHFISRLVDAFGYRVLSFSNVNNKSDVRMWSHYTDKFKGVCMKFDFKNDTYIDSDKIRRVTYDDLPMVNDFIQFNTALYNKTQAWKDEKEYRIISNEQYFKFEPSSLKEIYFGFNLSDNQITTMERFLDRLEYDVKKYVVQVTDKIDYVKFDDYFPPF